MASRFRLRDEREDVHSSSVGEEGRRGGDEGGDIVPSRVASEDNIARSEGGGDDGAVDDEAGSIDLAGMILSIALPVSSMRICLRGISTSM